jgi:hypothetical protein
MKSFLKINFGTLVLLVLSLNVFAQSSQQIENELVNAIKEVQKYSTYGGNYDEDRLSKANDLFEEKLVKYTKNAAVLKYNFPKLGDLIIIATSEDGRFRVYSWDLETGGTMHDYSRVYQYQADDGKVYSRTDKKASVEDGGAGSFVYSIFPVNVKSGVVYVVCTTFIGSTSDHYGAADLYKIEGSSLIDKVKLFKTKQGLTDSIGFEYDFFSVVNRKERPLKLIQFDKTTQTIKIPIVIQDAKTPQGRVTNKFINYKYDGNYFVRVN